MSKSLRVAYGEALVKLGDENKKIVVFDADLANATQTSIFKKAHPDRFFDMGIAETNMICAATGFSYAGYIPFCSTFALFGAGRAYEQIRNSVCYANANVKFGFSHSGLSVGEDGGSHQSIEDIALMRVLPNMTVLVPCDPKETEKAVYEASKIVGPVYIRVARPVCEDVTNDDTPFVVGKANVLKEGEDICFISCGLMIPIALKAAAYLNTKGISVKVINMHTIKPIDKDIILESASKCKAIVSIEEHSIIGGLGSAIAEVLAGKSNCKFAMVGINDKFGQSGTPNDLFEHYGLTEKNIVDVAIGLL
ncbi:MAG: transketolase family protein [Eubacteriales bacterium]|nr:transketolase family protein [Eubacteriales bacterium]